MTCLHASDAPPLPRTPYRVILCASPHWNDGKYKNKDGLRIISTSICEQCEHKTPAHTRKVIKQGSTL